jgi:hypothetical protein
VRGMTAADVETVVFTIPAGHVEGFQRWVWFAVPEDMASNEGWDGSAAGLRRSAEEMTRVADLLDALERAALTGEGVELAAPTQLVQRILLPAIELSADHAHAIAVGRSQGGEQEGPNDLLLELAAAVFYEELRIKLGIGWPGSSGAEVAA